MALVNYSSSSSSETEEERPRKILKLASADTIINKLKLPLPDSIKQYLVKDDRQEEPEQHEGRIRSFPHERGNWPTYLYIPYPQTITIQELQNHIKEMCLNELNVNLTMNNNLHLSLSRTVVLRHHWINSFIESTTNLISNYKIFTIVLNHLKIYCNDDGTRTFIGLEVNESDSVLLKNLVEDIDKCLKDFRLPNFYDEPSFHVSILWCNGNIMDKLNRIIDKLKQILNDLYEEDNTSFWIKIRKIYCKSGNKLFTMSL